MIVIPTKYTAGTSTGTPFSMLATQTVIVTAETLLPIEGGVGDSISYSATVKDDLNNAIPSAFVASLNCGAFTVITNQVFDIAHYDPVAKLLTLVFNAPSDTPGIKTVQLTWSKQNI